MAWPQDDATDADRVSARTGTARRSRGAWAAALAAVLPLLPAGSSGRTGDPPAPTQAAPADTPFANGFPDDPHFFPIGVWMQSPDRAPAYKRIGINTYVGLWDGPTGAQLSELAGQGLFAVAEQNEVALASPDRHVVRAWMHADEPDNAQATWFGIHVACVPPQQVADRTTEMKRRDPTRPVFLNFGRGVADFAWRGRGTCTGDTSYYGIAAARADIASFDIYPVANADPPVKGRLEYVARGVANLRAWARDARWVWAVIETAGIRDGRARPSAEQIRAEVWLALVAGARGIVYFVHEFAPTFREDGIFRHPDAVAAVARVDQEIRSLAPVLNSPPGTVQADASGSTGPVATMLKVYEGETYLFAVSESPVPSEARIRIPGIRDADAVVLGEDRTVHLSDGVLEEPFGPYDVHLYRLAAE